MFCNNKLLYLISGTEALLIRIEEKIVDKTVQIDITPLQLYKSLRHLLVIGSNVRTVNIVLEKSHVISYLNITDVHFLLRLSSFQNIKWFFDRLPFMEILDIQQSIALPSDSVNEFEDIFDNSTSCPLKAISLRNVQSYNRRPDYKPVWNLTVIFSKDLKRTLTYLDISKNDLMVLHHDILSVFPLLEILDVSENMFPNVGSFAPIILFHQNLKVVDCGRQSQSHSHCLDEGFRY